MEGYRNPHQTQPKSGHLTKLYSDTKKDVITSINFNPVISTQQSNPERSASLQRKLRIQKDRYLTWGLAWSDDKTGPDGNIDESVANAGLTEIVASVMNNVQEVIQELENGRSGGVTQQAGEKVREPALLDDSRYEDLLQDLTASNDTLYDLSRTRRALARGDHPAFGAEPERQPQQFPRKPVPSRSDTKSSSIADTEATLVNPMPFLRPSLSPYAGLPPTIDPDALLIPHEKPPPYESLGVPVANRLVGRLLRNRISESVQNALGSSAPEVPVLIEYASYDSTYKDTGVPPPLQRLEALTTALQPMRPESQHNISLLGYFEDPHQPRIGLVYDLPYAVQNRLLPTAVHEAESLLPSSLLSLIRKSKPAQTSQSDGDPPPLELRFKLALHLTEQLSALHQRGLPHGNVNSSSIVFANTSNQSSSRKQKQLGSPIWAAFDIFSKCSVEGQKKAFNLNIYRHPEEQSQQPTRDTNTDIRFDIYSLALILLEVGLWQSLGDLFKPKYSLEDFKVRLEKLWAPKLAAKCGTAYMKAVQMCLRACDGGRTAGMTTSALYDAILTPLRKCCLILDDTEGQTDDENASYLREMSSMSSRTSSQLAKSSSSSLQGAASTPAQATGAFSRLQPHATVAPSTSESLPQSLLGGSPSFKESIASRMPSALSLQDYGRKVSLIQQKWRERVRPDVQSSPSAQVENEEQPHLRQDARNEPAVKVEQPKPKLKEFPSIEIPQPVQDEWNNNKAVELARLVDKALRGSKESCSINLTTFGETPETARPTYLITCASTKIVKQMLKRHFRCDPKACYVRVEKGKITRCRRSGHASAARSMAPRSDQDLDAVNPDYQPQPACGASIGAYKDEVHLPPVSFGGIITVDGRSYGMSVHHMLEDDSASEASDSDSDDDTSDTSSILSMSSEPRDSDDDDSTVRQLSAPSDPNFSPLDDDTPGFSPSEGAEICITQPALDDAISLNLHADDDDEGIAEDHILSYKLGHLHASSGLKRTKTHSTEAGYAGISAALPQEIDWALFELLPPRTSPQPHNTIRGGGKFTSLPGPDSHPSAIAPTSTLANTPVHALGRTSGLASGTISSTMDLLKLHGRSSFAASWTVRCGGFGMGGDSGAWVVDSRGRVCGHVLAEKAGRTFICAMEVLVEDVRATLGGGVVGVPGWEIGEGEGRGRVGEGEEEGRMGEGRGKVEMRVRGEDFGGVALPVRSEVAMQWEVERERFVRNVEPVSSAG